MATAIFLGFPGYGHVLPSLPIIAELVRRGEKILYYATPAFQNAIEKTSATFCDYGAEFPLASARTLVRFSHNTRSAISVQLETSEWVLSHLLREMQTRKVDYVMFDSLCSWGWYVAHALGKPALSFYPTLVFPPPHRIVSAQQRAKNFARRVLQIPSRLHARRLSQRYHVPLPMELAQLMHSQGALNFVFTSRAFQPDAAALDPARFKFIGPMMTPRADAPAFPFEQLDERPTIFISMGTAFTHQPAFYKMCLDAFRETSWQIVMAVGADVSFDAEIIPENFIVRPMVPQLEVLKRTNVFITHGGMNSVNEALYDDVPLVMLPQGADHAWIAGVARALGVGIRLDKRTVKAQQLRHAVETILRDTKYKQAAQRIGASLRATGGAKQAADEIFSCTHQTHDGGSS